MSDNEYRDFVPVVFSRGAEEAHRYRELLDDHDIPAIVGDEDTEGKSETGDDVQAAQMTRGVPVLVPDALLDEASEVIADRESLEEFAITDEDAEEDDEDEEDELGLGKEGFGLEMEEAFDQEDLLEEDDGPDANEDAGEEDDVR